MRITTFCLAEVPLTLGEVCSRKQATLRHGRPNYCLVSGAHLSKPCEDRRQTNVDVAIRMNFGP